MKDDSSNLAELASLSEDACRILEEIQGEVQSKNRTAGALLKPSFAKLKDYYAPYLAKSNESVGYIVEEPGEGQKPTLPVTANPSSFFPPGNVDGGHTSGTGSNRARDVKGPTSLILLR